jgi:transcriptional regulator with XRE-family HTH domain
MTTKKTYNAQEKAEILAFVDANSVVAAHEKYGVSVNSINNWKRGGVNPKSEQLEKLLKFRDRMLERELQNPDIKNKVWDFILQDPDIRAKIGDIIMDAI